MDGRDEVISKQQQEEGYSSQTVIKGKRTKRQRPQSPIPFRMITPASDESSDICSNNNHHHHDVVSDDDGCYGRGTTTATATTATEEEEDMANCLILLAQGRSRDNPSPPPPPPRQPKFTSRKFMEVVATGGKSGSGGYYVYECKTCSKTFPSFQALGGHRASHKKPKIKEDQKIDKNKEKNNHNITGRIDTMNLLLTSDEEDPPLKPTRMTSPLSLQLTNRALFNASAGSRPRVHECSICGSEFSSGQALGGHMRRHRGLIAPPVLAAPAAEVATVEVMIKEPTTSSTLSLDLDLNLPAPAEDDVVFASKQPQLEQPPPPPPQSLPQQIQQPQQLVFSSRALVDCHY